MLNILFYIPPSAETTEDTGSVPVLICLILMAPQRLQMSWREPADSRLVAGGSSGDVAYAILSLHLTTVSHLHLQAW